MYKTMQFAIQIDNIPKNSKIIDYKLEKIFNGIENIFVLSGKFVIKEDETVQSITAKDVNGNVITSELREI